MTASLPPKIDGEHRWVVLAVFAITPGQAAAAHGGSAVSLSNHNRISVDVGCADCEEDWPVTGPCTAPASPELADLTGDFEWTDEDNERVLAAIDALARSGAKAFEVGHLEDDRPIHQARWFATVQYQGAKVSADEHANPVAAVEDLLRKILVGGQCRACGSTMTLPDEEDCDRPDRCTWHRQQTMWIPGCVVAEDVPAYIALRQGE